MKRLVFALLIMGTILTSCRKPLIDSQSAANVPVVQSYINCGDSLISVEIFKITPYSADDVSDTIAITGLSVYINDKLMNEDEDGIYLYFPNDTTINAGETYSLQFNFYGKIITASTVIPSKAENYKTSSTLVETERIDSGSMGPGPGSEAFDPIEITWDNPNNDYHFLAIKYMEETEDYINGNMEGMDFPTMRNSAPNTDNAFNLTSRDLQFFGTYRIILYSVNKEYAELYENVSSSSNNLTNPVSNIENGWGIFTGINSDTLYLEVKEE
jgi:hypothetical protein